MVLVQVQVRAEKAETAGSMAHNSKCQTTEFQTSADSAALVI